MFFFSRHVLPVYQLHNKGNRKMVKYFKHLIIGVSIFFFSTCLAEPLSLFSEQEAEKLDLSTNEWIEGIEHNSVTSSFFDIQAYSKPEDDQVSIRKEGPIVSIVNPTSSGQHYETTIPLSEQNNGPDSNSGRLGKAAHYADARRHCADAEFP